MKQSRYIGDMGYFFLSMQSIAISSSGFAWSKTIKIPVNVFFIVFIPFVISVVFCLQSIIEFPEAAGYYVPRLDVCHEFKEPFLVVCGSAAPHMYKSARHF